MGGVEGLFSDTKTIDDVYERLHRVVTPYMPSEAAELLDRAAILEIKKKRNAENAA